MVFNMNSYQNKLAVYEKRRIVQSQASKARQQLLEAERQNHRLREQVKDLQA